MFTYKKLWLIDGSSLGLGDDVMDLADCGNLPWTFEHKDPYDSIEHVIKVDEVPNLTDIEQDKGEETAYKVFLRAIKKATNVTVKSENLAPNGARDLTEDEEEQVIRKCYEKSKNRICRRVTPNDYMYNTIETYVPIDLTTQDIHGMDDLFEKAEIIFLATMDRKKFAALVKEDENWVCVNRPISVLKENRYVIIGAYRHTFRRDEMSCYEWKRNRVKYIKDLSNGDPKGSGFIVVDGYPLDIDSATVDNPLLNLRNRWFYFDDPGVRDFWYPDEAEEDVDCSLFFFGPNPEEDSGEDDSQENSEEDSGDEDSKEEPEDEQSGDEEDDDDIPVSTVAKIKIPKD